MKKYILGVEILTQSIHIVGSLKKRGHYHIVKSSALKFDGTTESAGIQVRQYIENEFKPTDKLEVILTIPETYTFLRQLEIPRPKNTNVEEAVYWEIKSGFSDLPQNPIYQWETIEQKKDTFIIGIIALQEKTAQDFASIFALDNVNLLAIEPVSLSLARICDTELKKNVLTISSQKDYTNITALANKVPIFSSSSVGSAVKEDNAWIKKTIQYLEDKYDFKIDQIINLAKDIDGKNLAKELKLSDKAIISNFSLKKNKKTDAKFYASLGAMQRIESEDMLEQINLLPKKDIGRLLKIKKQNIRIKNLYALTKINLFFITISILFISGMIIFGQNLQNRINTARKFIDNHPGQALVSQVQYTNDLIAKIDTIDSGKNGAGLRLKKIAAMTPSNLTYKTVIASTAPQEKWEIIGTGSRLDVLAFYHKIENEAEANQVDMTFSSLNKPEDSNFKITIVW